jgi:peptidoglycan hydrolase-like protein with peptidoglycan-binding domain
MFDSTPLTSGSMDDSQEHDLRVPGKRALPRSEPVLAGLAPEQRDGDAIAAEDDEDFVRSVAYTDDRVGMTSAVSNVPSTPVAMPVQRKAATGGNDALGKKENLLLQWKQEMAEVANEFAAMFTPLGLHFRPQILLATAMQEAAVKDPLNAVSFDNGLGLMQITPYKGKLDPDVAKSIGWDNSKSVAANTKSANWRNAKANLTAGAYTMLGKAKAIKGSVSSTWAKMDEPQRWRAVLFAYNAGEGSAISALRRGGPNASMISTYTNAKGQRVSHDYTKEIKEKMDYVDSHDPFDGGGATPEPQPDAGTDSAGSAKPPAPTGHLEASVGRGGANRKSDVIAVQEQLALRGIDPGKVDGLIGPNTIGAIERFQVVAIGMSDGLITPGKNTETLLFGAVAKVTTSSDQNPDNKSAQPELHDPAKEEKEHPSYSVISQNFNATIPGSAFTWHEAFWLPSWGRHVKASDVTNISIDTVIANVEKQAAALTKVRAAVGKPIVVHCWVRPPAYNRQIGGATNSAHLRGMATDFHCPGLSAEQVRQAVKSQKLYPGAGENNVSWVHLDLEHETWFSP